jgi:hypothetical protein
LIIATIVGVIVVASTILAIITTNLVGKNNLQVELTPSPEY